MKMSKYSHFYLQNKKIKSPIFPKDFEKNSGNVGILFNTDCKFCGVIEWYILDRYYNKKDKRIKKYIQRVGNNFNVKCYEKYITLNKKPTNIKYIMNKNCCSKNEAIEYIKDYKNKISFTKEKAIEKYGKKLGIIVWERYSKSKDSSSLQYFIEKYGIVNGYIKYNKKVNKTKPSLQNFIKKYGEKGIEKWNKYKLKNSRGINYFISKYGYENGYKKFKKYVKNNKNSENLEVDNYINVYGFKEGIDKYIAVNSNKNNKIETHKASKKSIKVFKKSLNFLDKIGIKYYIGYKSNVEFSLERYNTKKFYYDFTIPDLKLIFEYNGCHVHPYVNLNKKDLRNWKCVYTDKNYKTVLKKETEKKMLAIKNGFKVIDIWDNEDELKNIEKVYNTIMENLKIKNVEKIKKKGFNVKTRYGDIHVKRIFFNGKQPVKKITFEDESTYDFTLNHRLMGSDKEWKYVSDLNEKDKILTINGTLEIKDIKNGENYTWDIEVPGINEYLLANKCVTHNTSGLIINSTEGIEPIKKTFEMKEGTYTLPKIAPNLNKNKMYYENAFDIDNKTINEHASIRQKFIDQSQSVSHYYRTTDSAFEIVEDILHAEFVGMKSLYYLQPMKAGDIESCESCSS